ncbi:hypothetical protein JS756_24205 [Streptomyces actuosus]|uniref:HEAT repeat domain-containing protein n=1 Tax=Streptomyces actuosus TaxID=1885 RepID=A0ABS2VVS2_STRAS|nr:hypothetical protein [Streptomyces actuosus]MBN0047153.1 hypothetical protein [Streptomyces actuosus]
MDTDSAADGESALLSAVRAADAALVHRLLRQDSDPALVDAAFCLAVRMHAGHMAQLLLAHGADPGRSRPGELPPLSEAVEAGSPALVGALLHERIRDRYPKSELREMRDLARRLHEAGPEAGLRRRTGARTAVVRARVQDDEFDSIVETTLGGVSVRDGHAAILTDLEKILGIRASFEELAARALRHDQDHAAWSRSTITLARRRDGETWAAAAALRTHPAPAHRLFGAQVLRLTHLFDDSDADAFAGPALDIFTDWSTRETHPAVLAEVLIALGEHVAPRSQAALLPHAGHPDRRVRRAVAAGLGTGREPFAHPDEMREALLVLMTDGDATVRQDACFTVGLGGDRASVLTEAMAALLDDPERGVQLAAVQGLALHEDDRCVDAARRLGPPRPEFPGEEHCLGVAWRYEWRRDGR